MKSLMIGSVITLLCALAVTILMLFALSIPVGYVDQSTGRCIAVWDNGNKLSPCGNVSRYDERYAPAGVSTPEQLSARLGVTLSIEFNQQELVQK